MNRKVLLAASVLALGTLVYVGTRLTAQTAGTAAAPTAGKSTRVATLNLAYVIKYYQKCVNLQNEMKGSVKQFEDKITQKKAMAEAYAKEAENPQTAAARREELAKGLKVLQREVEDVNVDAKAFLTRKNDEQMVICYREIQDAAQRYALSHGIDLVLHYTDAPTPQEAFAPPVIDRKMRSPGCMPLYAAQGTDISYDVVMALNQAYGRTAPAANNGATK